MRDARERRAVLALLGVDETASWAEVRRAFRRAVRANHPDLHAGDPDSERRLKTLTSAWESINTPAKWATYIVQPVRATRGAARPPARAADPSVGRVRIQRQRRGSAGLLKWNLELDGDVVASIENGGVSILDAGPGRHSLRVFYGSRSSVPLQIEVRRGQELSLGCRQLESLRMSILSPGRCLVLERLGSRQFV